MTDEEQLEAMCVRNGWLLSGPISHPFGWIEVQVRTRTHVYGGTARKREDAVRECLRALRSGASDFECSSQALGEHGPWVCDRCSGPRTLQQWRCPTCGSRWAVPACCITYSLARATLRSCTEA